MRRAGRLACAEEEKNVTYIVVVRKPEENTAVKS
jgi:hypothetical protein